MRRSKSCFSKK